MFEFEDYKIDSSREFIWIFSSSKLSNPNDYATHIFIKWLVNNKLLKCVLFCFAQSNPKKMYGML